jgi:hypothetical protein
LMEHLFPVAVTDSGRPGTAFHFKLTKRTQFSGIAVYQTPHATIASSNVTIAECMNPLCLTAKSNGICERRSFLQPPAFLRPQPI